MQKAKERYFKEKAAEYYLQNKEATKEKSKKIDKRICQKKKKARLKSIIVLNKKEFQKSKQPINLDLI